jgi:hypothetical protein
MDGWVRRLTGDFAGASIDAGRQDRVAMAVYSTLGGLHAADRRRRLVDVVHRAAGAGTPTARH